MPIREPIEINTNSRELTKGFAEFKPYGIEIFMQILYKKNISPEIVEEIKNEFEGLRVTCGKPVNFGGWEGKISMSDDFNAPIDDFEEYM